MTIYSSVYPPAYNSTYVKAMSRETSADGCYEYVAINPAKSLTGSFLGNSWASHSYTTTNQRFHIDLGSDYLIKRIYYENFHNSGNNTADGSKNFTFWGSNSETAFAQLTYSIDTDWTQLTIDDPQFDAHVGANQADPKYVYVTTPTSYRYYACKIADNWGGSSYIGLRRIELQIEQQATFIPRIIWF